MSKLKNFYNLVANNDRIFTAEDIGAMSPEEFQQNERAIDYQTQTLGIPHNSDLQLSGEVTYVQSYTKNDGTTVKAHYRSKPHSPKTIPLENSYGNTAGNTNQHNNGYSTIDLHDIPAGFVKIDTNKIAEKKNYRKNAREIMNISDIGINALLNRKNPNAKKFLNYFLKNPKNLPSITSEYTLIRPGHGDYYNKLFNLKSNKIIPNKWSGFIFNEQSTLSQKLSTSNELKKQIMKNYDYKNNKFKNNVIELNFTKDSDLHRTLGHATLLNPHIDSDGNLNGIIYDKYDFDSQYKADEKSFFINMANDYFKIKQMLGMGSKYYYFVPIKMKMH